MLMTLTGFSVKREVPTGSELADSTIKRPLRKLHSKYNRVDSPELERQQSVSSEAEFSQKLHPEPSWHQTKIQSTRTYPQFGKLAPPPAASSKKRPGESDRWHIAVTKETKIQFEQEGVVLQELKSKLSNHAGEA
jgi:hypothetical protein